MIKSRAISATSILQKHGLSAMLFTDMKNIRYLTGFTGTDGALIVTDSATCFLTDSRYMTQAELQISCPVREYKHKASGIVEYLTEYSVHGSVGFESADCLYSFFSELQSKLPASVKLQPVDNTASVRSIKDASELKSIMTAAEISRKALESIVDIIQPGVTEMTVARELEIAALRFGSEEKAFDFIVASGSRGALPHGVASDKVIEAGEVVTIDFGSCFQGYFSDETVNFAIGETDPEMQKIHEIVLKAHDLAMKSVRPGVFLSEIDAIARDFISKKGYGTFFGHGLGHGVGLEVHEWPRVSPQSKAVAEEGMVFTIEPGIYVPGLGGVRIEDMVVVTENGCTCITQLPKELRQLVN